jgi:hypothetical protein
MMNLPFVFCAAAANMVVIHIMNVLSLLFHRLKCKDVNLGITELYVCLLKRECRVCVSVPRNNLRNMDFAFILCP